MMNEKLLSLIHHSSFRIHRFLPLALCHRRMARVANCEPVTLEWRIRARFLRRPRVCIIVIVFARALH
jgi:hypothetical protein